MIMQLETKRDSFKNALKKKEKRKKKEKKSNNRRCRKRSLIREQKSKILIKVRTKKKRKVFQS